MAKKNNFTEEMLKGMNLVKNSDGTWSKPKTTPQPREVNMYVPRKDFSNVVPTEKQKKLYDACHSVKFEKEPLPTPEYHSIRLILKGEPMPKQSVRSTKTGHHWQPQKYLDREKDYRKQIAEQLPKGFVMFTEEVKITRIIFMHSPLKGFHKIKGRMEQIKNGELIPKTTRGDIDNNFKPIFDSMSGLVFEDDSLIWSIDGAKKVFSTGGAIEIELTGK